MIISIINLEITVKAPINEHSKKRTPLISGRFYLPRPFPNQSLIKKFPKGGHSTQLADLLIKGLFLHEMTLTPILALQLADIEHQTGHRRQESKFFLRFFYFNHLIFYHI